MRSISRPTSARQAALQVRSAYRNHLDFYRRGPYASLVVETRSAGRRAIHMVHAAKPHGQFFYPAHGDITLLKVLRAAGPITRDLGTGRRRVGRYKPGELEIVAPGNRVEVTAEGEHEVKEFVLPFSAVRKAVEDYEPEFDGDFGTLHSAPFTAPLVEQICQQLWRESAYDNPRRHLFAEGAILTVAAELFRLSGQSRVLGQAGGHVLSNRTMTLINDYIATHTAERLSLQDLATHSGLSPSAFVRAFRATTGTSPYRYVLERRVARAQELLALGSLPLAQIAYDCGFASQSHMTDVFREKVGVTPGRYRKEMKR